MKYYLLFILLFCLQSFADVPPPGKVTALIKDSGGNSLSSANGALDVNIFGGSITIPGGVSVTSTVLAPDAATATNQVQIDTDLLAFKSANHTDLLGIDSILNGGLSVTSTSLAPGAATSALQTSTLIQLASGLATTSTVLAPGASTSALQTIANGISTSILSQLQGGLAVTSPISASISGGLSITSTVLASGASTSALQITGNGVATSTLVQLQNGMATTSTVLPPGASTAANQTLILNQLKGGTAITSSITLPVNVIGGISLSGGGLAVTSNVTPADLTTSGTITGICATPSAACPAGSFVALPLNGVGSVRSRIDGTFTGTFNFSGTVDGVIWFSLGAASGFNTATSVYATTGLTTIGNYRVFRAASLKQIRVYASVLSSGSIVVSAINASGPPDIPEVVQQNPLNMQVLLYGNNGGTANTVGVDSAGNVNMNVVGTGGLATSALQGTMISNQTNASQKTQVVDGSGNTYGPTTTLSGTNYLPVVQASNGSVAPGTVALRSTLIGGTYMSGGVSLTNNQQAAASLDSLGNLATISPDIFVTGQAAQTATVNNILTTTAGATSTDLFGYHSAIVQVISTGTGGTFIFEGSNDNVDFQSILVQSQALTNGTITTGAITASATQLGYKFPVDFRYIRLRIATTITGGSIQAVSKYSQLPYSSIANVISQNTAGNLSTTVTGSVTANAGSPSIVADVPSAVITTTTTTGAFTQGSGNCYTVTVPVTVASGTGEVMDIQVQESIDTGTNYVAIWDMPRITTTGSYDTPTLYLRGNRVRYVETIGGSSPSFTRAISRMISQASCTAVRQEINRALDLTTPGSLTTTLETEGVKNARLVVNVTAITGTAVVTLQGSDDFQTGTPTWQNIGQLTIPAAGLYAVEFPGVSPAAMRATTTSAASAATLSYVLIKGY